MQEIDTDYVVVGCGASAMAASLSRVASMKPISAVLQGVAGLVARRCDRNGRCPTRRRPPASPIRAPRA